MNKIDRQQVYNKYQGHCAYCGKEITYKEMHVDHIFPRNLEHYLKSDWMREEAGLTINDINEFSNLNPSCRICNSWKFSFTLEEFRKEIELQIERCNKYSRNYRMAKLYGLVTENLDKIPVTFYFENNQSFNFSGNNI